MENLLEGGRVPVDQYRELVNRIGNRLNAIGMYQKAVEFFDAVIAMKPGGALERMALQGKGTALFGLERYQEAIEQYDRIDKNRTSAPVRHSIYNNMGLAFFELGRYQEAIEQYNKALGVIEDWEKTREKLEEETGTVPKRFSNVTKFKFEPLNNKGLALSASGRYQEAIEQYNKALEARSLPTSHEKSDELIDNMQYFETDLNRENGIVAIFKTRTAFYLDRQEESNQLQHVALLKDQEILIIARLNIGITFYDEGRIDEANHKFDEVLRIDSNFAPGLFYKGLCLEKKGQVNEAIPYKQKAHEINPDYKGEKMKIALIQIPNTPMEEFGNVIGFS